MFLPRRMAILLVSCSTLAIWNGTAVAQGQGQGAIHGSGTPDTVPKFTGPRTIGDSVIVERDGKVGIGTTNPAARLSVLGDGAITGSNGAQILAVTQSGSGDALVGSTAGRFGVSGISTGVGGHGMFGRGNVGVFGEGTDHPVSLIGVGVWGTSNSRLGGGFGVVGETFSTQHGAAVFARTRSTEGLAFGVWAIHGNERGEALLGQSFHPTGVVYGVATSAASPNGAAARFDQDSGVPEASIIIGNSKLGGVAAARFRVDSTGKGFFNGGTQTGGADFAESVEPVGDRRSYGPGDVLEIDSEKPGAVARSSTPYSTRVAGIYSTKPGVLATARQMDDPRLAKEIPMAIVGIVPCRVTAQNGPISGGDLLVASALPGHAMKGTDRSRMLGAVVGKALEPLREGSGMIQVLVTLQ